MNWIIKDVRRRHRTLSIDDGSIRPHNNISRSVQRIFVIIAQTTHSVVDFYLFFPSFSFRSRPISFNRSFRLLLLYRVHTWVFKHILLIEIFERRKQKQQLSTSPHYLSRCDAFVSLVNRSRLALPHMYALCVYFVIARSHTCMVLMFVCGPFDWAESYSMLFTCSHIHF